MRAVLLDAATLGPEDLDFSHLQAAVGSLRCYPLTAAHEIVERLAGAQIA